MPTKTKYDARKRLHVGCFGHLLQAAFSFESQWDGVFFKGRPSRYMITVAHTGLE